MTPNSRSYRRLYTLHDFLSAEIFAVISEVTKIFGNLKIEKLVTVTL